MKVAYFIIIALFFSGRTMANTIEADRLFDNWEYFRAARLYQKESLKHPCADIYFKLGECYRKMHLYKEEQAAYDKVHSFGLYNKPEFYLNYGQVLRSNSRNEEAKMAFRKYSELVPSDKRGNFFGESIDIVAADHNWDEPVKIINVRSLNTPVADLCPVVYKDGIVFTSSRKALGRNKIFGWTGANYLDLYYAKNVVGSINYTDVTTFSRGKIIKKFNDGPACFSKNFDTIYISRVDKEIKGSAKRSLGIERVKIFISAMKNGKWTKAFPFHVNSNSYSVANPFLAADGSRLYFVSDMPGGYGETDIYYCNRMESGWGQPINMGPNVNTFNRETSPLIDAKGNCYFASDGYQGFGGLDICVALNKDGILTKAAPLKYPFNSPEDDLGILFLNDGRSGYISSNRSADGFGDDDILFFDLAADKVDPGLVVSIYTIGYRPPKSEYVKTIIPDPKPAVIAKASVPLDVLIYFDFDKHDIRTDAVCHLDSVISYMNTFPDLSLVITGNCDCRGTSDYNKKLAIRRSNATLLYLKAKGINADRITGEGYGYKRSPIQCKDGVYYSEGLHQLDRKAYCHFE